MMGGLGTGSAAQPGPGAFVAWGWGLDPAFAASHVASPAVGRLTLNILDWLAKVR